MSEAVSKEITYIARDGNEIKLTHEIIKGALTKGDSAVTNREVYLFGKLCEARRLNPFIGDAYLVKWGDRDAQLVTSKDFWLKMLKAESEYKWHKAGILVAKEGEKGLVIDKKIGTYYTKSVEQLVGGWAEIMIGDELLYHDVSLDDFARGNLIWKSMPAVMIRKVALAQLAREVVPEEFGGMYIEEELPSKQVDEDVPEQVKVLREEISRLEGGKWAEAAKNLKDLEALQTLYISLAKPEKLENPTEGAE